MGGIELTGSEMSELQAIQLPGATARQFQSALAVRAASSSAFIARRQGRGPWLIGPPHQPTHCLTLM